MSEVRKACVVLTLKEDGSFEVMDANGQIFHAKGEGELGGACAAILADDDLPDVTTPSPIQVQLERVAEQATQVFAAKAGSAGKALAPLVKPVLIGATNGVSKIREARRQEANERQQARDKEHQTVRKAQRANLLKLRGAS